MKYLYLFFFFFLYSLSYSQCYNHCNFYINKPENIVNNKIHYNNIKADSIDVKFDSIREIEELASGNGEAFPWLSPDGKR